MLGKSLTNFEKIVRKKHAGKLYPAKKPFYRLHPKDGEGTVFTGVCSHRGGGGVPTFWLTGERVPTFQLTVGGGRVPTFLPTGGGGRGYLQSD